MNLEEAQRAEAEARFELVVAVHSYARAVAQFGEGAPDAQAAAGEADKARLKYAEAVRRTERVRAEALVSYVQHRDDCYAVAHRALLAGEATECVCGLNDALAAYRESQS